MKVGFQAITIWLGMKNLSLEFVNSEWYDGWGRLEDRLSSPKWMTEFLRTEFDIPRLPTPSPEVKRSLYRLRSLLREMIEQSAKGGEASDEQLIELNSFLSLTSWKFSLSKDASSNRLGTVPLHRNWHWVQTSIAASACELLFDHDRRRIKVCPNEGCCWIFYDETKGRTRRWCTSTLCGNLDKVRRYRIRKKNVQIQQPIDV